MKKLVNVDKEDAGMMSLIGERVTIFCCRYIYTGKLVGVNEICVELEDPSIVYETGNFTTKEWKQAEALTNPTWFVATGAIESYGIMK